MRRQRIDIIYNCIKKNQNVVNETDKQSELKIAHQNVILYFNKLLLLSLKFVNKHFKIKNVYFIIKHKFLNI